MILPRLLIVCIQQQINHACVRRIGSDYGDQREVFEKGYSRTASNIWNDLRGLCARSWGFYPLERNGLAS